MSMKMKVRKKVHELVRMMRIVVENQGIVKFGYTMLRQYGFEEDAVNEAVYILEMTYNYNRFAFDEDDSTFILAKREYGRQYAISHANEIKRFITSHDYRKILIKVNGKIKAKVKEFGFDVKTDTLKVKKMGKQVMNEELDSYLKT